MTWAVKQRLLVTVLVGGVVGAMLLLGPAGGKPARAKDGGNDGWIDQLTGFVVAQQGIAQAKGETGTFEPYLDQLALPTWLGLSWNCFLSWGAT